MMVKMMVGLTHQVGFISNIFFGPKIFQVEAAPCIPGFRAVGFCLPLGGEILLVFTSVKGPVIFVGRKKIAHPNTHGILTGQFRPEVLALAAEATQLNQALAKWGWLGKERLRWFGDG